MHAWMRTHARMDAHACTHACATHAARSSASRSAQLTVRPFGSGCAARMCVRLPRCAARRVRACVRACVRADGDEAGKQLVSSALVRRCCRQLLFRRQRLYRRIGPAVGWCVCVCACVSKLFGFGVDRRVRRGGLGGPVARRRPHLRAARAGERHRPAPGGLDAGASGSGTDGSRWEQACAVSL